MEKLKVEYKGNSEGYTKLMADIVASITLPRWIQAISDGETLWKPRTCHVQVRGKNIRLLVDGKVVKIKSRTKNVLSMVLSTEENVFVQADDKTKKILIKICERE